MKRPAQKKIKFIDTRKSDVNILKRAEAYIIDWVIGGIITGFPAVLIYAVVTGKSDAFSNLYIFQTLGYSSKWAYISGILCVIAAMIYYVYIPYKKYPGQTLGKRWMKLKIVKCDSSDVDLKTIIKRQVIGLMLIEATAFIVSGYLRQMVTLLTGNYLEYYLKIAGNILTIISIILVVETPSQRAIHDYISNTKVVKQDNIIE